jgi:hypothetical protein
VAAQPQEGIEASNQASLSQTTVRWTIYLPQIYRLYSLLFDEEHCHSLLSIWSSQISKLKKIPFKKFEEIFIFRIAYQVIERFGPKNSLLPGSLSTKEATVLVLRDALGFSVEAISAIINTSEGSIRTRIERSRRRLWGSEDFTSAINTEIHSCFVSTEAIEDHTNASLNYDCSYCKSYNQWKDKSKAYFHNKSNPMPENLSDLPTAPIFIKEGNRTLLNWSAAPWYVRILAEGFLATTLIMGLVFSIPKLKYVYELWVDKRIDMGGLVELASHLGKSIQVQAPLSDDASNQLNQVQPNSPTDNTELATLPEARPAAGQAHSERPVTKVTSVFSENEGTAAASHKIYRILIKTDSPDTMKITIDQLMTAIEAAPSQLGANLGVDLPGGVLYDVYIPVKKYKNLIQELGKFGEMKVIITQSHQKMVPGKARIKVWLQRI